MVRSNFALLAVVIGLAAAMPAAAQIDAVDPDDAMQSEWNESDYGGNGTTTDAGAYDEPYERAGSGEAAADLSSGGYIPPDTPGNEPSADGVAAGPSADPSIDEPATTYQEDDLIAAAGGLFGDGAEGLARMIERVLADQGEPNGYIVGREVGGAFIFGLRYGSGTLFHKVEGQQPVYWTGPSVGFDVGANGASTFVLVYNLYDTDELFQRFPAVEGDAYFIGGLTASYMWLPF
ncbi:MAG: DUF1134 domain-containing protein [Sphingomonadales bacterium]|nr:DUF1134 domain-containing protein [Sphingomonadales bacterium]